MARAKSTIKHNPLERAATPAPGATDLYEATATLTAEAPAEHSAETPPEAVIEALAEIAAPADITPEPAEAATPAASITPDETAPAEAVAEAPAIPELIEPAEAETSVFAVAPDDLYPPDNRGRKARGVVRRFMAYSGAAGLLPLPVIDVAAVTGVQVKMLYALSKIYEVPFNARLARQLVLALLGGGGSVVLALPAASATKFVPVVGTAASFVLSPAFATLSCYAVGRTFVRHFEAGGTLETFEPGKAQTAAA